MGRCTVYPLAWCGPARGRTRKTKQFHALKAVTTFCAVESVSSASPLLLLLLGDRSTILQFGICFIFLMSKTLQERHLQPEYSGVQRGRGSDFSLREGDASRATVSDVEASRSRQRATNNLRLQYTVVGVLRRRYSSSAGRTDGAVSAVCSVWFDCRCITTWSNQSSQMPKR